jgi:hypothetical protein
MMTEPPPARPRKAKGPDRPAYFDHADIDRVMAILLALASEVASIRERLDTHERLAAAGASPSIHDVEAYRPDDAAAAEREAWNAAYIRRLFRVITEDIEALRANDNGAAGETG